MQPSLLLAALAAAVGVDAIYPPRGSTAPKTNGTKLLSFNETVNGILSPSSVSLAWVASDVDGQFIYAGDDGALILANAVTGENETFVAATQVPADNYDYWISADLSRVLWATNYTKQYRHSYFADYFVLDIASGSLDPLVADQAGDIQYAEWDPSGEKIAFVRGNDLYIWTNGEVRRITSDGDPNTFNAVPDWVMEEEILGDRYALWWSPDGEKLAYLSFNETGVPTFRVQYYLDNTQYGNPYPRELELRYPKVDAPNPKVSFNLLDVASSEISNIAIDAYPANDTIIGEVAWVTDDHSNVLFRAYNRVQDSEKVVNVDVASKSSSVVRERSESEGWLDNNIAIAYVGAAAGNGTNGTYYLDLSDVSGWTHIYLYPVNGGAAIPLTSGEWEVRAILKVDTARSLVYYTSTEHHSTESHLYSVSYKTFKKTPLVDDTTPAYWSASFSSGGAYYALSYQGPDVPYQELYSINSTTTPLRTLVDNADFYATINEYKLPEITWFELDHPSGQTLNVLQRLPANFDPAKKYPVLFNPYGGPGAQQIPKTWQALSWTAYAASDPELEYAQWIVDNRGTGYKGRVFRAQVAQQLGSLEAEDQVWAAEQILKNEWADADHVAIWGWSFGGYLSSKVVELDSGVFTLGLITAPVSDWRFYDSMYTERYMKTYAANAAGYNEAAVRKTAGFKNIEGGFLLTHGLGDDNVHFQHSAVLADVLMGDGVGPDKFDSQWFTDSDHSIRYNEDSTFLYKLLTKRLYEEKNRVPGEKEEVHQWSRREIVVV